MPASTKNLRPIIVYLPDREYTIIKDLAESEGRSISNMVRILMRRHLAGDTRDYS